ncbi:2-oxoglutarate and iron-dependent oxygenase domain-containing protein 2 isoform X1 [Erpetoichthys calabaricus]|uniref:2-oxoglutarate and iron-dependent oxygenase domain containing 2 n=2 Tax=Erpetoichthys calabaricus TaxID=27687 RepID=A0A8C4XHZ4_ERPCA|nr:2-oxoglutarate and iron-dependent oxygenase domain-containing protein 2 isoform X1 [Erpetoichthys calabaricus]
MSTTQFYHCSCFYTDNIFLTEFKLHIKYTSEEQFRQTYGAILRKRGCSTTEHFQKVLKQIEKEIYRRKLLDEEAIERSAMIREIYKPFHRHVYVLQESYLAPEFLEIVTFSKCENASMDRLPKSIVQLAAPRTYRIPVFTEEFCRDFIEELENFEQSEAPKGRPNTMNNYGVLLNELGFDATFLTPLREAYLCPVASLLFSDCGGDTLDSHKAFVVKYALQQDLDLSYHYDNAEVTLNVSLGKDFTEGSLYFGDMRQVPISETECVEIGHETTHGLLHRGQHMHGALPLTSGQRWNLIIWMRSSVVRNQLCPMCNKKPELVEGDGFADGFTREAPAPSANTDSCVVI